MHLEQSLPEVLIKMNRESYLILSEEIKEVPSGSAFSHQHFCSDKIVIMSF